MKGLPISSTFAVVALAIVASAVTPSAAGAQDLSQLSIHGFGSWAYRRTNTNEYIGGSPEGSYRSVNFALSIAAAVQASLTVDGQVHFDESAVDEHVDVDYAFAEWRFSDALQLRAGKIQLPFGIYTEVFRVGSVRPFPSLPQSIYGPTGFISEASKGVGLRGAFSAGGKWEVQYDVYGGGLDVPENDSSVDLAQNLPPEAVSGPHGAESVRDVLGGRVNLRTPITGLRVGVSGYSGIVAPDSIDLRKTVVGAHAEYLSDLWWLRGEFVHEVESQRGERVNGMYLEVARFLSRTWQVAGRYEHLQVSLPDNPSPPHPEFLRHSEVAGGVNYWFTPEFGIKGAYSFIAGNRYAKLPVDDVAGVARKTRLLQFGAEFSF